MDSTRSRSLSILRIASHRNLSGKLATSENNRSLQNASRKLLSSRLYSSEIAQLLAVDRFSGLIAACPSGCSEERFGMVQRLVPLLLGKIKASFFMVISFVLSDGPLPDDPTVDGPQLPPSASFCVTVLERDRHGGYLGDEPIEGF